MRHSLAVHIPRPYRTEVAERRFRVTAVDADGNELDPSDICYYDYESELLICEYTKPFTIIVNIYVHRGHETFDWSETYHSEET